MVSSLAATSHDPLARLPALAKLRERTPGSAQVRIGILDGPVELDHPALGGAALTYLEGTAPLPSCGGEALAHGTHVASLIFGQSPQWVVGIAPQCRGLLRPIFADDPSGGLRPCSLPELSAAIVAMADRGAHLINVSAGARLRSSGDPTCLTEAVLHCERAGVLLVAAAGNDGCAECLHVPGRVPSPAVLVVGAMNAAGQPLAFSNWGRAYARQGLLAPGENLLGAVAGGQCAPRSGTSYATAVVSGVCGLLLSLQVAAGQQPDALAVREALLATVLTCDDLPTAACDRLLAGRLSISRALVYLGFETGESAVSDLAPAAHRSPEPQSGGGVAASAALPSPDLPVRPAAWRKAPRRRRLTNRPRNRRPPRPAPRRCFPAVVVAAARLRVSSCSPWARGWSTTSARGSARNRWKTTFAPGSSTSTTAVCCCALNMLRYLLGWDGRTGVSGKPASALPTNGHLYDAKSLHWVLYQDDCPLYAIAPQGPFAEVAYKELIYFFVENQGLSLADYGVSPDCINEYLRCHGGLNDPLPAGGEGDGGKDDRANQDVSSPAEAVGASLQESPGRVARIAIAGEVVGRAELATGESVEVIAPTCAARPPGTRCGCWKWSRR